MIFTSRIDKAKFNRACEQFAASEHVRSSIGTLGEKSLHATLKWYYESDGDRHEIPIGNYIADIVGEHGIIEIQTRNFIKMKPKLAELLEAVHVTVIYPLINQKQIINMDYNTGEVISSRKSPKRENIYSSVHELYAIKPLLKNPNLTIKMPVLSANEIRVFGVHTQRRRKQHTRKGEYVSDIIPADILDEIILSEPRDYRMFCPENLPEAFNSADFAQAAHSDIYTSRRILNILNYMDIIENTGKNGRTKIYRVKSNF